MIYKCGEKRKQQNQMMLKLLHVNDAATPQKQWIPEKMMMMKIMVAVCESSEKQYEPCPIEKLRLREIRCRARAEKILCH